MITLFSLSHTFIHIMIQMIYSKHTIHNNINVKHWGTLHHQLHIKFENTFFEMT